MPTFSYIDTSGQNKTVEAPDANIALSTAQNIDPHSGVQAMGGVSPQNMGENTGAVPPATGGAQTPAIVPEHLTALGVTPEQYAKLSTPEGMNSLEFSALTDQIQTKLRTNNELQTQKQLLLQHLYGTPLTPDLKGKLPADMQDLINTGNKSDIEFQVRLLNDQIANRGQTLTSSIQYLTQGYEKAVTAAETQRKDVQNFMTNYAKQMFAGPSGQIDASSVAKMKEYLHSQYGTTKYDSLADSLLGTGGSTSPIPGGSTDPISAATSAIVSNESSGNYSAVSPVIPSGTYAGQHSYGKYQILESNIGPWTKQYYGQELTPQEFLANTAAQDAVAKGHIGELWNQYGNIKDVASVYFTGVPYAQAVAEGRKDRATGETVQDYVAKAEKNFNSSQSTTTSDPLTTPPDQSTGNTPGVGIAANTQWTPNTVWQNAIDWAVTGKNVQSYVGGLGGKAAQTNAKNTLENVATALATKAGVNLSDVQQDYKALSSAENNTMKAYTLAKVNEQTANGYFEQIKTLGSTMDDQSVQLAVPILNNWVRTGEVQLSDNPAVNNYVSAITEALTEYAKVVTGQTSGQGVTVAANKQAQDLLSKGLSTGTVNDWIDNVATPFMNTRISSYQENLKNPPPSLMRFYTVAAGGDPSTGDTSTSGGGTDYTATLDSLFNQ